MRGERYETYPALFSGGFADGSHNRITSYNVCYTKLLRRLQQLLSQILTRSAYLQLLAENPGAMNQLLDLCAASGVVAGQLARYPILLA